MLKIAVVVYEFPVISETFVLNHINALAEAGHNVTVFSLFPASSINKHHFLRSIGHLPYKIVYGERVPASKTARFKRCLQLLIRNTKSVKTLNVFKFGKEASSLYLFFKAQVFANASSFDIIHCHFGNVGNEVQKIRNLGLVSGKLVVSFHGYEFLKEEVLKRNGHYQELFTHCEGVVANSTFTLERLKNLGCPPGKLVTIPVIPNTSLFQNFAPKKEVRSAFKLLTVARLVEKKGITYALEAISILKKNYGVTLQYDVIGKGDLLPELQDIINRQGLQDEVKLHGAKTQEEVAGFFSEADLFLLPSIVDRKGDTETQGLVLIEVQLMRIPVVSTTAGGISDSVRHNQTGLLEEEKNPHALAEAIHKFYVDPDLRKKFGDAGEKFVLENFNAKLLTDKMIAFYQQLL